MGNKSKDFSIKRIADGDVLGYGQASEWQDSSVLVTSQIASFTDKSFKAAGVHSATIQYDPDADFDYCVCDTVIHDGTLLFIHELFYDILKKIITVRTFNAALIPEDFQENSFKYDVHYTIGDFVWRTEYGSFSNEKPWLRCKTMAMLPIKIRTNMADKYQ